MGPESKVAWMVFWVNQQGGWRMHTDVVLAVDDLPIQRGWLQWFGAAEAQQAAGFLHDAAQRHYHVWKLIQDIYF